MGERFRRQEKRSVNRKIAQLNIRRAALAGAITAVLIPILMIFGSSIADLHGSFTTILIMFEVLSLGFAGACFMASRSENFRLGIASYRGFWITFEAFSFYIAYVSRVNGAGVGFYSVMMCVLTLVPVLSLTEMVYGAVAELVFILLLSANTESTGVEIFNILVLNAVLIAASRAIYSHMREFIALKENSSERTARSLTDIPTGFMNGKGFEKAAYSAFSSCVKYERNASVIMVDIDDLKGINSALGSRTGDECIKTVAGVIRSLAVKYTNLYARLDGGKFAVFMECSDSEEAVRLGEKIRNSVVQKRFASTQGGNSNFLTVSVGISCFVPESEKEFALLYEEAEDSLMSAKENGKNLTVFEDRGYGRIYQKAN